MKKSDLISKMISFYEGNLSDINHFLKVYAFAKTLGEQENLGTEEQEVLEIAAIVHDIACPLCREKYGTTAGHYQEAESEKLLKEFFGEYDIASGMLERLIFIVCRHHTYDGVDIREWQLLLEADYLVNAHEMACSKDEIIRFRDRVFKSKSGIELLNSIYL